MNYRKKEIFLSISIFIAACFCLDFVIGSTLRKLYFNQKAGIYLATTYSFEKANEDMIVIGSSRATHHYTPDVCDSSLQLSFYNAGRDGEFICYYYALLEVMLKRHKPKVIILDFKRDELNTDQQPYANLSDLFPYYKDHPEIRPIANLKGRFERIKLISKIYPYNSIALSVLMGSLELNKKRKEDIKGYVPLYGTYQFPATAAMPQEDIGLDSVKIKAYSNFISECRKNSIKLAVVVSPYYLESSETESIKTAKLIAKKNKVDFLDYSHYLVGDPSRFKDLTHLNSVGAVEFSKKLQLEISRQLKGS